MAWIGELLWTILKGVGKKVITVTTAAAVGYETGKYLNEKDKITYINSTIVKTNSDSNREISDLKILIIALITLAFLTLTAGGIKLYFNSKKLKAQVAKIEMIKRGYTSV